MAGEIIAWQAEQERRTENRRTLVGIRRELDQKIEVNSSTVQSHDWLNSTNGWRFVSVQVGAAQAVGIRLHLENIRLPPGARILLYDAESNLAPSAVIDGQDLNGSREIWSPTVFSELVGVECQVPSGVSPSEVAFAITEVSQIYRLPSQPSSLKEGACENDVSCAPDYQQVATGIALISYVHNGNTYICSGCLLSTTAKTAAEYFLTARHCIGNQALASTLEFFWLFQTPECGGAPPAITDVPHTTGGAALLAAGVSDFSFLKLKVAPPTNAAHLQWSVTPPNNSETLATIHHPDGKFKRISFGTFVDSDIYNWAVQWSSGVTESGSSGSPLLNGAKQVIGQLTGGFSGAGSSCDNPGAPDEFGRFDVTYPFIKKWIDPSGIAGGPPPVAGVYSGLFYDQSVGVSPDTSGSFSVKTTVKGKVAGKLTMWNATYAFRGQLDLHGGGDRPHSPPQARAACRPIPNQHRWRCRIAKWADQRWHLDFSDERRTGGV